MMYWHSYLFFNSSPISYIIAWVPTH